MDATPVFPYAPEAAPTREYLPAPMSLSRARRTQTATGRKGRRASRHCVSQCCPSSFSSSAVLTLRAAEKSPATAIHSLSSGTVALDQGPVKKGLSCYPLEIAGHVLAAGVSVRAFRCCGPVADSARLIDGHRLHNCLTHRLFLSSLSTRMKDSQSPVVTDCLIL